MESDVQNLAPTRPRRVHENVKIIENVKGK